MLVALAVSFGWFVGEGRVTKWLLGHGDLTLALSHVLFFLNGIENDIIGLLSCRS